MTSRQVYVMLARIAGHICADGQAFVKTEKFNKTDMRKIQSGILALLEKLDYDRAYVDFRRRSRPLSENPSLASLREALYDGSSTTPILERYIDEPPEDAGQP